MLRHQGNVRRTHVDDAIQVVARNALTLFYHAISQQDIALLRTIVTSDWQYIPASSGDVPVRGAEAMIPAFAVLSSALADMHIIIVDILIHRQQVGVRARVTGTQSGPLLGIPATSKPVDFAIHSFHELRTGKIAKTWHLEDWLGVFQQLGEMPPTSSLTSVVCNR